MARAPSPAAGSVELRVHPTLIPKRSVLANISGVLDALAIACNPVSAITLEMLRDRARAAGARPDPPRRWRRASSGSRC